ncbi:RING-H2 finger protein ATL39 [Eutrema salsugineum]|uniref:RING-H2 finger protein ATL39 n=1 Tax=Eutrema salsugineum TaxID=72664 RepID=UPI000CECF251|nr:RING-H2 finger protein ATL39 [Eutrema salsugineum]
MGSNCCGDYVAASPEMAVTESESIALRLLCVVFIVLFYGSIFLLCFVMYPKVPKEAISDEESGDPLPPAVRLTQKGVKCSDGGDGDGIRADLCVICLENFEVNDVVRVLVGCKHVFHVQCIDSWCFYKLTCPVCRAPFQWFSDW